MPLLVTNYGAGFVPSGGGGGGWTPAQLFTGSELGGYWDASDLSTLWTDDAETTQAGNGDDIARWNDLSGNGNTLFKPSGQASGRPTLRQSGALWYVEFDGVNDELFGHTVGALEDIGNDFSFVIAVTPGPIVADDALFGFANSGGGNLAGLYANDNTASAGGGVRMHTRGVNVIDENGSNQSGVAQVLSGWCKSADQGVRRNGTEIGTGTTTGTITPNRFTLGNFAQFSHFGRVDVYAAIFRAGKLTTTEFEDAEAWASGKAGL